MTHTERWSVEVFLFQHETGTTARARLRATGSAEVIGEGTASRPTAASRLAEVVDEVAVGRALVDLGHRLTAVAGDDARGVQSR